MIKKFKKNNGQVAVIVAILITVLVGMAAYSIDIGSLYQEKRQLQTVADAAALAGAQELPENPEAARQIAVEYAAKHGVVIHPFNDIKIENRLTANPNWPDTIVVTPVNQEKQTYFAGVFGFKQMKVAARATAMIAKPLQVGPIVPWTVDQEIFNVLSFGEETTLIFDSPQKPGNFAALDLGGQGASSYAHDIRYGYDGILSIGQLVDTEPGNMGNKEIKAVEDRVITDGDGWHKFEEITSAETKSAVKRNETQVVIVPIISFEEVDGGKGKNIPILDFGIFVITEISGKNPGQAEIIGAFVDKYQTTTTGEVIPVEAIGLRVIRLIKNEKYEDFY